MMSYIKKICNLRAIFELICSYTPSNMVLSVKQRTDILLWYMETKRPREVQNRFKRKYSDEPPAKRTIYQMYLKFVDTGTTHNLNSSGSGRPRSSRSDENISAVKTVIPKKSVRRISAELQLSTGYCRKILNCSHISFRYGKV